MFEGDGEREKCHQKPSSNEVKPQTNSFEERGRKKNTDDTNPLQTIAQIGPKQLRMIDEATVIQFDHLVFGVSQIIDLSKSKRYACSFLLISSCAAACRHVCS